MAPSVFSVHDLLPDLPLNEFLNSVWPDISYISRGCIDRLSPFISLDKYQSIETLLSYYPGIIELWGNDTVARVRPSEAKAAYMNRSHSLYFPRADRFFSELPPLLRSLEVDLGIPTGSGHCSIFASPRGRGATMHYDYDYGFNVLLLGTKCWTHCRNETVEDPLVSYNASSCNTPESFSKNGFVAEELATELPRIPSNAQPVLLSSGDTVFTPRGWWHATNAIDDCIALDFSFAPPRWLDLVSGLVMSRLANMKPLRKSVLSVSGIHFSLTDVQSVASSITESLRRVIASITAEDLVALALTSGERVRPCVLYSLTEPLKVDIVDTPEGTVQMTLTRKQGELMKLEVHTELVRVVHWITSQVSAFTLLDLLRGTSFTEPRVVCELIHILSRGGILSELATGVA